MSPLPLNMARFVAVVALTFVACGEGGADRVARQRRAAVERALASHLTHEEALLEILERHRDDPEAAGALAIAYTERNAEALEALCGERRLLEDEPEALAHALANLQPRSRAAYERKRRLYEGAPELMANPQVQRALAALDDL